MTVRLVVADDEADLRLLLRLSLSTYDDLEVVAEAADGLTAARAAAEHDPDVVVLDWRMPGVGGAEAIPLIRQGSPRSRILMYTARPARQADQEALAVGADGYLEKTAGIGALVSAIRLVAGSGNGEH